MKTVSTTISSWYVGLASFGLLLPVVWIHSQFQFESDLFHWKRHVNIHTVYLARTKADDKSGTIDRTSLRQHVYYSTSSS